MVIGGNMTQRADCVIKYFLTRPALYMLAFCCKVQLDALVLIDDLMCYYTALMYL